MAQRGYDAEKSEKARSNQDRCTKIINERHPGPLDVDIQQRNEMFDTKTSER